MYDLFQTIHVIAAVAWVGGGLFHVFASAQLAGAGPDTMLHWARVGSAAGTRYYMPTAIVTLLAGIAMVLVGDGVEWSDPFISIGFGGIIASIVLGAVLIERTTERMVDELESDQPDPGTLGQLGRKVGTYSVLDSAILLVVVWAMVARPGG